MLRDVAFAATLVILVVLLAVATALGALGPLPPPTLRKLAVNVLNTTYNPTYMSKNFSADAPEAVTAVVWDYRGLDTVFETAVFYGAIVGTLALYREILKERSRELGARGLSTVVKVSTAVVIVAIGSVGLATALHGQLTPGGGFQAGSITAVIPVVLLVVFSRKFLEEKGVDYGKLVKLRSVGLVGIALAALAIAIAAALTGRFGYVLQNQPKIGAPLGFPPRAIDVPSGGSLMVFNILEMVAVAAGFAIVFLALSIPEREARREVVGEERGY